MMYTALHTINVYTMSRILYCRNEYFNIYVHGVTNNSIVVYDQL